MSPTARLIGHVRGGHPGPTVICVAGIHGNEPAGVQALRRVLDRLETQRSSLRGELIGLIGNLQALERGVRYVEHDLNRMWRAETLDEVRRRAHAEHEVREMVELDRMIRSAVEHRRGPAYFLDLHTTSSRSVPFAVISDTLAHRAFARRFPIPIVLGLEEQLQGAIADYAHELGCTALGVEAGRHDDPVSVDLHEAIVELALRETGALDADGAGHRNRIATAAGHLPEFLEVVHQHQIDPSSDFEMGPRFENFQHVRAGDVLARDRGRDVRAPLSARIFMPLYQGLGDAGFYLVRPIRPIWMKVSRVVRALRLGAVAPWLPGVRRHPTVDRAVIVHRRIARWLVPEIFHLLGYRRVGEKGAAIVFVRRAPDAW